MLQRTDAEKSKKLAALEARMRDYDSVMECKIQSKLKDNERNWYNKYFLSVYVSMFDTSYLTKCCIKVCV